MWRCRMDCPVYSYLATFGERGVFACIPGYRTLIVLGNADPLI